MKRNLLLTTFSLASLLICSYASSAQDNNCPKIKPRSRQEVVMMAASSDKNGCWIRQKDGNLVFVSNDTPDHYKSPLPNAKQGAREADGASSSRTIDPLGIQGTWDCGEVKNTYGDFGRERLFVWIRPFPDTLMLAFQFHYSTDRDKDHWWEEVTFELKGTGPSWSQELSPWGDDSGWRQIFKARLSANQLVAEMRTVFVGTNRVRPDEILGPFTCVKQ